MCSPCLGGRKVHYFLGSFEIHWIACLILMKGVWNQGAAPIISEGVCSNWNHSSEISGQANSATNVMRAWSIAKTSAQAPRILSWGRVLQRFALMWLFPNIHFECYMFSKILPKGQQLCNVATSVCYRYAFLYWVCKYDKSKSKSQSHVFERIQYPHQTTFLHLPFQKDVNHPSNSMNQAALLNWH